MSEVIVLKEQKRQELIADLTAILSAKPRIFENNVHMFPSDVWYGPLFSITPDDIQDLEIDDFTSDGISAALEKKFGNRTLMASLNLEFQNNNGVSPSLFLEAGGCVWPDDIVELVPNRHPSILDKEAWDTQDRTYWTPTDLIFTLLFHGKSYTARSDNSQEWNGFGGFFGRELWPSWIYAGKKYENSREPDPIVEAWFASEQIEFGEDA